MNRPAHLMAMVTCVLAGCSESAPDRENAAEPPSELVQSHRAAPPAIGTFGDSLLVNSFGMKFIRIEIENERDIESSNYIPEKTYYLQQTEVTGEHLNGLRDFAKENNIGPKGWLNIGFSEWRDISNLAVLMSQYDPAYDYGLPSRSQWVFACMSGYEQRCDENAPNALGFVDMLDNDVEVIDELGILMGRWINNWGEHTGKPKPDCRCEHWTKSNPDADDSLNEIIVGRFVLLPEGTVQVTAE